MTTYLVTGEAGCYSDWGGWLIAIYRDEASALAAADTARQLATREAARREDADEWDDSQVAEVVAVVAVEGGAVRTVAAWQCGYGPTAGVWTPIPAARWPGGGYPARA